MTENRADRLDALMPADMATKAEAVGVAKAALPAVTLVVLGVLAGAFIALGAVFSTVTITAPGAMGFGVMKLLGGLTFSLGLILVIVAGAELFTGNNLIVMAWASRRVSTAALMRNWVLVYLGNLIGALGMAALVYMSGHHHGAGGEIGVTAIGIATAKCQLGFTEAVARGVLCNLLVCLAVWLTFSARTTTDRILAIVPPIAAFVACGFEHCVANMYFIPYAMLIAGDSSVITWGAFVGNLVPVTIGNLIGGTGLVGAVYWFVYLRRRD